MQRIEAVTLTRKVLDEHGLRDWHIRLMQDLSQPFLGKCMYQDKCIVLNAHHIDTHPTVEVENTIKHEVAHALTPGHQHDEVWAAKAKELGCTNTSPCASYGLDARAIDAIRSGATLEVSFDEQVIRTPKYKITRLQDKCPECGKVAEEIYSFEANKRKIITLKCGHVIWRVAESYSPFEDVTFDGDESCAHEWQGTICIKCNAKKLYAFQVESCKFLEKANGRAGIFHEMGLGKTVISTSWLKYHPEALPALFIVKSGIKFQFAKEIVRILGLTHFPQIILSSKAALIPARCYIIGYDMLVPKVRTAKNGKTITSGFDIEKFKTVGIKTVILDECQQIKNPDSSRTQMVRRVVKDVPHIIPLSGTPWKNRGNEFFPVLNMLDPYKFNSYDRFEREWVEMYWDGAHRKVGGIARPAKFKEYVKDIIIRKERAEVMKELPLVQRNAFYCEMNETASKAYSDEVSDFVKFWNTAVIGGEEDSFQTQGNILARLTRMRHITGLAKIPQTLDFTKEFLEETERKLVIFVHHKDVGQILFDQLTQHCIEEKLPLPLRITSEMSGEARFDAQEKFNSPNYRLMIASTLAAGEGLNLQTCADCILHERQWNPANEEQAEGRFIRIGQQANAVTATYMLAEGSIDDIFHGIVERKRASFHASMNNSVAPTWNQTSLVKELGEAIVKQQRGY